jgi:methylaspartate mutase sigma subunit
MLAAPPPNSGPQPRTLLTSTASDSHTWNLVFLELLLEEHGHEVVNLGACVPTADVVAACRRVVPDLLVVSTVNGHGTADAFRLAAAVRSDHALPDMRIVLGGKLGIRGHNSPRHVQKLLEAGFDAVFDDAGSTEEFEAYLRLLGTRAAVGGRA